MNKHTDQAPKSRADQLRNEINAHNYRYYVLDDPIISDAAYDKLFTELSKLEDLHPSPGDAGVADSTGRCSARRWFRGSSA